MAAAAPRTRRIPIDVVIARSLVIAVLASFIVVVYATVAIGGGQLVGGRPGPLLVLQVVATAIVAVAFEPLRVRVGRFADRVVLGRGATPYEVLSGFSRQAANTGDGATLQRIVDLLAAGTGASTATVWLRVGEQLRPAAVSGDGHPPHPRVFRDGGLPDLDVTLSEPVLHEGDLLGVVTLTKPENDPPSRQDEELTARLAAGLSLVLRNARLTAELQDRRNDLEASRQRIVHAQDDARRKIEADLRSGVLCRLDELVPLLAHACGEAADAGAERTAALLRQLDAEVDDAVRTLRDLAQGIHPPLLESQGLGPALADWVQRLPLPVTLHASGVGRHGRDVEAAVYFCVLEALHNATKYAQATALHVRLELRDGILSFDVADDGVGFDPAATGHGSGLRGMADRLDTIGGDLTLHASPGAGARITGRVPVGQGAGR